MNKIANKLLKADISEYEDLDPEDLKKLQTYLGELDFHIEMIKDSQDDLKECIANSKRLNNLGSIEKSFNYFYPGLKAACKYILRNIENIDDLFYTYLKK